MGGWVEREVGAGRAAGEVRRVGRVAAAARARLSRAAAPARSAASCARRSSAAAFRSRHGRDSIVPATRGRAAGFWGSEEERGRGGCGTRRWLRSARAAAAARSRSRPAISASRRRARSASRDSLSWADASSSATRQGGAARVDSVMAVCVGRGVGWTAAREAAWHSSRSPCQPVSCCGGCESVSPTAARPARPPSRARQPSLQRPASPAAARAEQPAAPDAFRALRLGSAPAAALCGLHGSATTTKPPGGVYARLAAKADARKQAPPP